MSGATTRKGASLIIVGAGVTGLSAAWWLKRSGVHVLVIDKGVVGWEASDAERDFAVRRGNSMRLQGVDALLLDRDGVRAMLPMVAMDMTMDGSPFICKTPVSGLYFNGGWCYGGFKATPASGWCFAHTIATDEPHPLNADLTIGRFREGRLIDERGAGASPWAQ